MAGLFLRALGRSNSLDPGFDPENVMLVSINPQPLGFDRERTRLFYENVIREARRRPGLDAVSLSTRVPLGFGARFFSNTLLLEVPGHQPPEGEEGFWTESASVSDQFFKALRIPILQGRSFAQSDRIDSRSVAIVNQTFAERFWPGQKAVGRKRAVIDQSRQRR